MNYIEHSVFINKSNCSFIRLFSANSYTYSVPGTWSSHCASLSSIKPWKSHPDIDIRIEWGKNRKTRPEEPNIIDRNYNFQIKLKKELSLKVWFFFLLQKYEAMTVKEKPLWKWFLWKRTIVQVTQSACMERGLQRFCVVFL